MIDDAMSSHVLHRDSLELLLVVVVGRQGLLFGGVEEVKRLLLRVLRLLLSEHVELVGTRASYAVAYLILLVLLALV